MSNVFVANAGTGHVTPFLDLTIEEVDAVVALNLTGAVYCCQRAAQLMVERPGRLIYAATKAALNQAIRVAATELAAHDIRICGLSPGITETPLTAANPDAFEEAVRDVPLGRAGQPEDLAEAAYFLCPPQARFITGANLVVDGGESLFEGLAAGFVARVSPSGRASAVVVTASALVRCEHDRSGRGARNRASLGADAFCCAPRRWNAAVSSVRPLNAARPGPPTVGSLYGGCE